MRRRRDATDAQWSYLARLYRDAFAARVEVGYDTGKALAARRMTVAEASAEIDRLKAALAAKRSVTSVTSPTQRTR